MPDGVVYSAAAFVSRRTVANAITDVDMDRVIPLLRLASAVAAV